jgi:hypothetical protein
LISQKDYKLSTLKWEYSKNSSGSDGEDRGWVDGLMVGTGKIYPTPDENSEALDSNLKFTKSGDGSWSIESGTQADYYYDGDSMKIADTNNTEEGCLQTIVESDSSETIKFHWKISGESGYDYLKFYIDNTYQGQITGEQDWQPAQYTVSAGIHTLKWVYCEGNSSGGKGWKLGTATYYFLDTHCFL